MRTASPSDLLVINALALVLLLFFRQKSPSVKSRAKHSLNSHPFRGETLIRYRFCTRIPIPFDRFELN